MKRGIGDLAILGGPPAFEEALHVGRPHIGDRQAILDRIGDMLDRRWLTNSGPYTEELEERVADYLGVRHCVLTCNGTTALQLAARALELAGEVIVPSFTFVATVHALSWTGLTPVFCDVDPATHNIDAVAAEKLVTDRTAAIVGVHLWGQPCAVEAVSEVAERHGLRTMFDAAHAFGCSSGGRLVGGSPDAEVFSFHATKVLNAFEGGAITTNDDGIGERARLMRNFGFADYDRVTSLGTNGKMSEAAAAMGLASFERLDAFIASNRANYLAYQTGLKDIDGLSFLSHDETERRNYQHVVVEVDPDGSSVSCDTLIRVLWAENVLARRYFHPGAHRMEPYRSSMPDDRERLPVTDWLADRTLLLPNGGELEPTAVARVCDLIRFTLERGADVRERLQDGRDR